MSLSSSTPDALSSAPSKPVLHPVAVSCTGLRRGRQLDRCTLSVPAGARLLIVSDPEFAASTLLRVLAGLDRYQRGFIRIAGTSDPTASGWGRRAAYVGPETGLYSWMTPRETLRLAGELLGLPAVEAARRIDWALDWTRVPPRSAVRPMSRGGAPLQQRVALAAALIGDPEVLLLDRPLHALEAEERMRLLTLPGRRRTILMASRDPAGEAALVAHVAYLRDGRVALIAPVGALERAGLPLSRRGIAALADVRPVGDLAARTAGA